MGISGLLRALKSVMVRRHLGELKGQVAAVDALGWLHRGTYCCSTEICVSADWSKCIAYCMKRVDMLRHFGVKPVLVFDGDNLPMKKKTDEDRQRSRKEALARGYKLYKEGRGTEAQQEFIKAVDVTPAMIKSLIEKLKAFGIDYVVAPYEADAQLAYLQLEGKVDFVISEDSDCIAFGCDRVLFKLDNEGFGDYFDRAALGTNTQLSLKSFTHDMVLDMCILAGCDYLDSLPGMGIVKAHKFVQQYRKTERVLRGIRFSGKTAVPRDYEDRFVRARLTFRHQLVHPFSQGDEDLVPLTAVDAQAVAKVLPVEDRSLHFAGPKIDRVTAGRIARGEVNAISKRRFADEPAATPLVAAVEKAARSEPRTPGPMDRFMNQYRPNAKRSEGPAAAAALRLQLQSSRASVVARQSASTSGGAVRRSRHFSAFVETSATVLSACEDRAAGGSKRMSERTATQDSDDAEVVTCAESKSPPTNEVTTPDFVAPSERAGSPKETSPLAQGPRRPFSAPQEEWHDVAEELALQNSASSTRASAAARKSVSLAKSAAKAQMQSAAEEENLDLNARKALPGSPKGASKSPSLLSLGSGIKPTPRKRPKTPDAEESPGLLSLGSGIKPTPTKRSKSRDVLASASSKRGAAGGPSSGASPKASPNPFRAFTFSSAELSLDTSP